jgi:hypothetical protein
MPKVWANTRFEFIDPNAEKPRDPGHLFLAMVGGK